MPSPTADPIAIIGWSCRFPGGVRSPEALWQLLAGEQDAMEPVPASRWDSQAYFHPDRTLAGTICTEQGGFLTEIDLFDHVFFGITPAEAELLDPQARLLLELSYEALAGARQPLAHLRGSLTGTYVGVCFADYRQRAIRSGRAENLGGYHLTGNTLCCVSGRLAFAYGLEGPAVSLDTACSSSLVALHYACADLRAGTTNLALAGGVNLLLDPATQVAFSSLGALAPDARCKAFDQRADGYGRSEGAAIVVLKRLADAERDGDPILGLVPATALTNDGRSRSFTAPNPAAQARAIRMALAQAGLTPNDIGYFEAHGTGTPVGDAAEMEAIGQVFGQRNRMLPVGSVKTNIGHTESASGLAGLFKALLAVRHGQIPANLHFAIPSSRVNWAALPVYVPIELTDWQRAERPRVAGVNSFGISGTNAHVLVQEYVGPTGPGPAGPVATATSHSAAVPLLLLSARSPESLQAQLANYEQLLLDENLDLPALCAARARGYDHFEYRLALPATTAVALREELANAQTRVGDAANRAGRAGGRVAFVLPGQGGQWPGMGQDLLAGEPIFATELAACDADFKPRFGWSLVAALQAGPGAGRWDEASFVQPLLFSFQVALARVWMAYGVLPDVVVGHSVGEVAAAYLAGVLSLADCFTLLTARSRLAAAHAETGAMALVELPRTEAEALVAPYGTAVAVAASNSPTMSVLSGERGRLEALLAGLNKQGKFNRLINVDFASHSPLVEPMQPALRAELVGIQPIIGHLAFYSTVLNRPCAGPELDADYWVNHLRQPVLFAEAIEGLLAEGVQFFVEINPHPLLTSFIDQVIEKQGADAFAQPAIRRDQLGPEQVLSGLASSYEQGLPIRLEALFPTWQPLLLPAYPFTRQRFWLQEDSPPAPLRGEAAAPPPPLSANQLMAILPSAAAPATGRPTEAADVLHVLRTALAETLKIPVQRVEAHVPLNAMGFDSLIAARLRGLIKTRLGLDLPMPAFWNFPTLAQLGKHVTGLLLSTAGPTDQAPGPQILSTAEVASELDKLLLELNLG